MCLLSGPKSPPLPVRDENGCLSAIFQLLDPSFPPSVDRPLLRWKSISGHAKGYPETGGTASSDRRTAVHPTHAWQAVGSHFCNANAAHRRVARKANLHIPMSRENPFLASSNCLTPLGERATLFRGREREIGGSGN